jgi:hypothetical protein
MIMTVIKQNKTSGGRGGEGDERTAIKKRSKIK